MNIPNYKSENLYLTTDLRVRDQLTSYTEDSFFFPFKTRLIAICRRQATKHSSLKILFPGFSYFLPKASGSKCRLTFLTPPQQTLPNRIASLYTKTNEIISPQKGPLLLFAKLIGPNKIPNHPSILKLRSIESSYQVTHCPCNQISFSFTPIKNTPRTLK